jgi:hypothetical protein
MAGVGGSAVCAFLATQFIITGCILLFFAQVVEQHPDMAAADVAAMYGAMLAFAGAVYPDNLDYVDKVLQTCHDVRPAPACLPACLPARCLASQYGPCLVPPCAGLDGRL